MLYGFYHIVVSFSDAQSADRESVKIQLNEFFCTIASKLQINTSLYDTEQQLPVISMSIFALLGPFDRPGDRFFKVLLFARKRGTLIETHYNIRTESILHIGSYFCIDIYLFTIYVTGKFDAFVSDPVKGTEGEDLVSAAVSKYRSIPTHQVM